MGDGEDETIDRVVGYVLAARKNDRGATARIRAGMNPQTENRAYADILPLLPQVGGRDTETAYLRAAALIAAHPEIGQLQGHRRPIGASFRRFSMDLASGRGAANPLEVDAGNPDSIATRLGQLPNQDLDAATLTFNRVLTLGDGLGVQIDYFNLTRTLLKWGHGVTSASIEVRRQPLRDYYRYRGVDATTEQSQSQKEDA